MTAESSYGASAQEIRKYSQDEKLEILRKLQQIGNPNDSHLWAKALRERESRGERLSQYQKQAWREVLKVRDVA